MANTAGFLSLFVAEYYFGIQSCQEKYSLALIAFGANTAVAAVMLL